MGASGTRGVVSMVLVVAGALVMVSVVFSVLIADDPVTPMGEVVAPSPIEVVANVISSVIVVGFSPSGVL